MQFGKFVWWTLFLFKPAPPHNWYSAVILTHKKSENWNWCTHNKINAHRPASFSFRLPATLSWSSRYSLFLLFSFLSVLLEFYESVLIDAMRFVSLLSHSRQIMGIRHLMSMIQRWNSCYYLYILWPQFLSRGFIQITHARYLTHLIAKPHVRWIVPNSTRIATSQIFESLQIMKSLVPIRSR